ncbi:hypothetical protein T4D_12035 [Trichinella pseudospiralis]|uniref:K Homology domain-containing protein n=1 Tax=Trichinella pseudospiralis TaxID=6337 RepID=A0A0V1FC62_TRIPS|nr:hypothetical protein T4D_12035 [Trichinella pseudospiralis]
MSFKRQLFDGALLKQGERELLGMVGSELPPLSTAEKAITAGCVEDEFLLEMFKNIPSPPRPSGAVVNRCFTKTFTRGGKHTFNDARKIIGPCGFTVRAIEQFSGCKIRLNYADSSTLRAELSVVDYETVSAWRIEAAKHCIDFVINRPSLGRRPGDKIQPGQTKANQQQQPDVAHRTLLQKNQGSADSPDTWGGGGDGCCGQ